MRRNCNLDSPEYKFRLGSQTELKSFTAEEMHLDIKYDHLERIDIPQMVKECNDKCLIKRLQKSTIV
jgi:hypothetical protein